MTTSSEQLRTDFETWYGPDSTTDVTLGRGEWSEGKCAAWTAWQAVLQSEQVKAWKKDAERLNWIEEQFGVDIACDNHNEWWMDWAEGYVEAASMRDAIDAALEKMEISDHELNTN